MTGRPTTIDLGVIPPEEPELDRRPAAPPWPVLADRWARQRPWWTAAVLVALLILTMTTAAPPRQPWLVPHFTVPAGTSEGRYGLTEEILYVVDRTGVGTVTMTAYRLADGATMWEAHGEDAWLWNGWPTLVTYDPTREEGRAIQITPLDPDTGEERWPGKGDVTLVDDLLIRHHVSSLTAVDWESGEVVWTLPSVLRWTHGPDVLVTMDGDGRLATYRLATGAPLATGDVVAGPDDASLSLAGDLLLVHSFRDEPVTTGYDLATLTRLWTAGGQFGYPYLVECGPVLCIDGGFGPPQAIDPVTGELAWSADWYPDDGFALRELGPPWPPGYLLVYDGTDDHPTRPDRAGNWLIDAATGEPLFALQDWRPAQPPHGGPGPIVTRYDANRAPVVEQLGPGRQRIVWNEAGRTWFGRYRVDPPGIEVLGAADSGPAGCAVATGYVACEDRGEIHAWRIR